MYRQLGTSERTIWLYDRVRSVHFTLTANIIGKVHLERLKQALAQVQQRHPLLNVKIALDRTEIPWLITETQIIPIRVVKRHSPQQWQQEVERELTNWELARSIKTQLDQKINSEQIFADLPNSEAFISTHPSPDDAVTAIETAYIKDITVSNLGRLKIPQQYGELQLAAVYSPSIFDRFDRDLVVGVITLGGRVFFSLTYSESGFSVAQIEQFQQTAMQILQGQVYSHQN
jgi:hypothetical protein